MMGAMCGEGTGATSEKSRTHGNQKQRNMWMHNACLWLRGEA
jgi:hypothetical protein